MNQKRHKKRTTMKDIAEALQLDRTTVSKALSDKPGLSDLTRKLVLEKAEQLGYIKDVFASGLMTRKNKILGLVLADISRGLFAPVVKKFQQEARAGEYGVILCNLENSDEGTASNMEQLNLLRLQRVSGITFVSNGTIKIPQDYYAEILDEEIAFNTVESSVQLKEVDQISFNHRKAGYELTQYLIGLGHKKIAFITYSPEMQTYTSTKDRMSGYLDAMQEAGLTPTTFLENERYSKTFGDEVQLSYELLRRSWPKSNPPTAVIGANDTFALGMLHSLKDMGLSVPGDVSVAGFDDLYAEMGVPSITSMRMPVVTAGELAAQMLIQRIKEEAAQQQGDSLVLDYTIIVRGSTGACHL